MFILRKMMRKALHPLFLLISGLLFVLISQLLYFLSLQTPEELAQQSGKTLEKKYLDFERAFSQMDQVLEQGKAQILLDIYDKQKIALYRFSEDSLIFWNNSRVNPEPAIKGMGSGKGLAKLSNGYYIYEKRKKDQFTDLALALIKPEYPIQNNYLKNELLTWTGLDKNLSLSMDSLNGIPVKVDNLFLFSIKTQEQHYSKTNRVEECSLLFFIGIVLLLFSALKWCDTSKRWGSWIVVSLAFLLIRGSISVFRWPAFLYQSSLYDLHEFGDASRFLNNYLGDILLNVLFLLFFSVLFYRYQQQSKTRWVKSVLFTFLLLLSFHQFNQTIASLVENSTLSFDFLSVFSMKPLAIFGVAFVGICSVALMVSLMGLINTIHKERKHEIGFYLGIVILVCLSHYIGYEERNVLQSFWLLIPATGLWLLRLWPPQNFTYTLLLFALLSSVVASSFFTFYLEKNQQSELKLTSFRLSERQDPALENEYKGLPEKIANDQRIKNLILLLPNSRLEIAQLLKQNYFNAYFDRYSVEFALFDKNCTPLLEQSNPVYWNQGFFEDQLRYHSDSTFSNGMYFVKDYKFNSRYISKIALGSYSLFIVMEAKELGEQGSFPDLLLDESQQKQEKLGNLSYAVYRSDRLMNHFGEFNYPHFITQSEKLKKEGDKYKHFVFKPEEDTQVIISEKVKTSTEKFTYNSYFFLIFSLVNFLFFFIYRLLYSGQLSAATLTQRIQASIVVLLLLAMSAVGITSGRLVTRQFENENKKDLSSKCTTLLNELLSQFTPQDLFEGSQKELVNQKIKEYARVFNSDLSLFNAQGKLVNTSQPKLYDLGLSSDLVNPTAYQGIKNNRVFSGIVTESAGKLKYFSHYEPVYDDSKVLLGFINLPYFAKQSRLTQELSSIISALINVYLVLFMLSLASGLVLSRYIIQPLRIIKQQIARIALGQRNESIQWQSNDEIGKLVKEYNQMLFKLEESATLLAQSERESAWREMAKQVAHEIKNPLTPMKLNLQYLQHLNKTSPEDFKLKFEQASAGIIEQIDALANIASEFSNFAKLPGIQLQDIAPLEILQNAVQLFNKLPNLSIEFQSLNELVLCKGDKEQCMRVFNNILSNAVEALEDKTDPKIVIRHIITEETLQVSISDNGCGITEERKPSIFTPSFTTKSTGSGLGLAMVKNIMLGFGGKVWFESETDKGSTFFLEFDRSNKS